MHFCFTYAVCFSQGRRQHCCSSGEKASSLTPSMIVSLWEYSSWSQTPVLSFGAGSQEIAAALSLSTYLQHFLLLASGAEKVCLKGLVFFWASWICRVEAIAVPLTWEAHGGEKVTSGAWGLGFFLTDLEALGCQNCRQQTTGNVPVNRLGSICLAFQWHKLDISPLTVFFSSLQKRFTH